MFETVQDIINFYTKEAKPMQQDERYELLRQAVREYIEQTDKPDLDDLMYRNDLTSVEKRYIENIYAVEMEKKERASA
jgi:hypothetical protein